MYESSSNNFKDLQYTACDNNNSFKLDSPKGSFNLERIYKIIILSLIPTALVFMNIITYTNFLIRYNLLKFNPLCALWHLTL